MGDKAKPDETHWFDPGPFPMYFGFVPNKRAWRKTVKSLGAAAWAYPKHSATCSTLDVPGKVFTILVTVNPEPNTSDLAVEACLAHEAVHVMQYAIRNMTTPGKEPERHEELEAYLTQWAFQCCVSAWREYRAHKTS